LVGVV